MAKVNLQKNKMSIALLKPKIFSLKNRTLQQLRINFFNKDTLTLFFAVFLVFSIYGTQKTFLLKIMEQGSLHLEILSNTISLTFMSFFFLLIFSNTIVAISSIFMSEEINLFLSLPISKLQLFTAKIIEILSLASWFFVLLITPTIFAYYTVLNLPPIFVISCLILMFLLLIISSAIGIIITTLFVNLIPPQRIKDVLIIVFFFISCYLLSFDHQIRQNNILEHQTGLTQMIEFLQTFRDPHPTWLPSYWITQILTSYILKNNTNLLLLWSLTISTAIGIGSLSFLVFDLYFKRGLTISTQSTKFPKIYFSELFSFLGRVIIPFNQQLRAIIFKEAKIFIRDTTQALQLLMLLVLTFIYLYNFRILNASSQVTGTDIVWWKIILSLANIGFGNFVIVAIATRFIYPSISLEGRSFPLLCATPVTIEKILQYKFYTWLIPTTILSCVLLDSGIMAINGSLENLCWTNLIAIALSIGIVGLGIGIGAVYAKFDWESPAQITASFGSLVYMFISICVIGLSTIPAMLLLIIGTLPEFTSKMDNYQYWMSILCSVFLLFFINIATARKALAAGVNSLKERNRL